MPHQSPPTSRPAVLRRSCVIGLLLAAFCISGTVAARAQPGTGALHRAYEIKAAYLYNFTKFITWPDAMLPLAAPIRVCVLGENPFDNALAPITQRTVGNHPLQLMFQQSLADPSPCHVLFISGSEAHRLSAILEEAHKNGTLTVSDLPGFAEQGGIIGFVVRDDKIRLEINLSAARQARLQISAKLLELATIIQ